MTDTVTSQNIDLTSWNTLYGSALQLYLVGRPADLDRVWVVVYL
jgi:hypothetical protein